MLAAYSNEGTLQSQMAYYKIRKDVETMKAFPKYTDLLRIESTPETVLPK